MNQESVRLLNIVLSKSYLEGTGIYKITNTINNKVYIGQSKNIYRRLTKHLSIARNGKYNHLHLYRAISKYGIGNFYVEVLEKCTVKDLDKLEYEYIQKYNSVNKGYNMTLYISPRVGYYKLTEDELKALTEDLKLNLLTKEYLTKKYKINRQSINDINTGRTYYREDIKYPIRLLSEEVIKGKFNKVLRKCKSKNCGTYYQTTKGNTKKYCSAECYKQYRKSKSKIPSKEELELHMNTYKSFLQVGKIYKVSDKTIINWCKRLGLPNKIKEYV